MVGDESWRLESLRLGRVAREANRHAKCHSLQQRDLFQVSLTATKRPLSKLSKRSEDKVLEAPTAATRRANGGAKVQDRCAGLEV